MSYAPILAFLAEFGPASSAEIAEGLGEDLRKVVADCSRLRRPSRGGALQKRIYIHAWSQEHPGARRYPRPLFAVGSAPDKPKPGLTPEARRERGRRYYHDRAGRTITSVWDLARSTRDRGLSGKRA